MPRVPRASSAVLLLLISLAVNTLPASEIRLVNGQIYPDAVILREIAASRDTPASVVIQVRYGTMALPIDQIETVDGRRFYPKLVPVISNLTTPVGSKPGLTRPSYATPRQTDRGVATNPSVARPSASPVAASYPTEPRGWNWRWFTLAALLSLGIWGWTVYLVRHDCHDQPDASHAWWIVAAVLPIVGFLLYQAFRQFSRKWVEWRTAKNRHHFELLDADHNPIVIQIGEEVTGIENAKGILEGALRQRASDVHIEPSATECRVRFRIDGTLYPRAKLNPEGGLRLISALKSLAQIDISERRRAQDGRFAARIGPRMVDFRAATTPSVHGEKLVIRILDRNVGLRNLNDLGMPEHLMKGFTRAIHSRAGMILATGPTGSGKTSSLYAALSQLDSNQLNLVTIEDPVEYELAGATQIPVNAKAGVTFESGLRSILRQDPDVIFVGEMRDLEAAQIALRSALTGHLVFSSLHTRDAMGTITRLEEMGIERHLISSALIAVIAQRLVRVLCRACRQAYPCVGNELEDLGFELPPGETIYRPGGCRKCEGTGYEGRTGVFEMLILDEDLRNGVNAGPADDAFLKLARAKGFRSYREEAAQKVLLGVTSAEEVLNAN